MMHPIHPMWGRGGSRIFLGGGALVSFSTSTPINHIVFFRRIPVVLENRRSSQVGEGGGQGWVGANIEVVRCSHTQGLLCYQHFGNI